jgi:hypothetical protein
MTGPKLDFIHFLTEEALEMSHLRHGGCVFLIPDAYLDMQKSRKSTRNGPILPHRLVPKMDKVELSESSKLMSHASEPKLFGEHTCFSEALGGRKASEVVNKAAHLVVQGSILVVRADDGFRMAPEVFQGVKVGTAFGQPQKLDAEGLGQAQRTLGGVTGVFI